MRRCDEEENKIKTIKDLNEVYPVAKRYNELNLQAATISEERNILMFFV